MKSVLLLFPDVTRIADFVIDNNIKNAEVNCVECSLTANMDDDEIIKAVSEYEGFYKTEVKPVLPSA